MKALILIDIQNDYFPKGKMELHGSEAAGIQAGNILNIFREKQWHVFHVQHISTRAGASFFLPDTDGINIHSSVKPHASETIVIKHHPNAFRETNLLQQLQSINVNDIVIAGMMTQMCVDTTTRAASDLGLTCTLAHDACATRDLVFDGRTVSAQDVQTAYMAGLDGLFARVLDTKTICAELSLITAVNNEHN